MDSGGYVFHALPAGPITPRFSSKGSTSVCPSALTVRPGSRIAGCRAPAASAPPRGETGARSQLTGAVSIIHRRHRICACCSCRRRPRHWRRSFVPAPRSRLHLRPCQNRARLPEPPFSGTIRSRRDEDQVELYTTGAALVIDRGLDDGLEVGQNLVVRRYYRAWGARARQPGRRALGRPAAGSGDRRAFRRWLSSFMPATS